MVLAPASFSQWNYARNDLILGPRSKSHAVVILVPRAYSQSSSITRIIKHYIETLPINDDLQTVFSLKLILMKLIVYLFAFLFHKCYFRLFKFNWRVLLFCIIICFKCCIDNGGACPIEVTIIILSRRRNRVYQYDKRFNDIWLKNRNAVFVKPCH